MGRAFSQDQKLRIFADRDIKQGEELCICYVKFAPYEIRRRELMDIWKIDCTCDLCSLPETKRRISDGRREKIESLVDEIRVSKTKASPLVQELIELRKAEGIFGWMDRSRLVSIFQARILRIVSYVFQCLVFRISARMVGWQESCFFQKIRFRRGGTVAKRFQLFEK